MNPISSKEALNIILSCQIPRTTEFVEIETSLNRVLAEDIYSDRDFPPFAQVRMDGIAIQFEDFRQGRREFAVDGIQAAGQPKMNRTAKDSCIEVMTGAILPGGTDSVIRYEDISLKQGFARIEIDDVRQFQNVQSKGSYRKAGTILISKNTKIDPPELAILASVGKSSVLVKSNPSVCIVSTGNELVDIFDSPEPHQLRRSNSYTLRAELRKLGIRSDLFHFNDELEILRNEVRSLLGQYSVLIFSGAVSKGKFDFLPKVFSECGVKKRFHGVLQRPGKPFWFGTTDKNLVFAFPGNPVSSFLCFHKYFLPWIHQHMEYQIKPGFAKLSQDLSFTPSLSFYCPVFTSIDINGTLWAIPVPGKGSGDLVNLLEANAFMEFPADRSDFHKSESYPIILFR